MTSSPKDVLADPKFQGLPAGERLKVLGTLDPNFKALPMAEQMKVIGGAAKTTAGTGKTGARLKGSTSETSLPAPVRAFAGAGSGLISTMTGGGRLAPPGATAALQPGTTAGKIGKGIEQTAEYFAPIKSPLKGPAGEALKTGAIATAQTGEVRTGVLAGATAGGMTALGSAMKPVVSAIGRKIQASTIRPRLVDVRDGFKWATLDKFKLKGNLEQSMAQVDAELTRLRTQRNALIAPGKANVNLANVFDEALADVTKEAKALEYGHMGPKAEEQVSNMRHDIEELISPKPKAQPPSKLLDMYGRPAPPPPPPPPPDLNVDISKAENLKEFLGTLGAWAYGRGDPDAKVTELVANTLYAKVRSAIEKSLGSEGPRVQALNKQMQELIPVKHAMLARLPVEERNRMFSLADIVALMPAMVGDVRALGLEGLTRAQKSLRFGNWLVRNAAGTQAAGATSGKIGAAAVRDLAGPGLDSPQ